MISSYDVETTVKPTYSQIQSCCKYSNSHPSKRKQVGEKHESVVAKALDLPKYEGPPQGSHNAWYLGTVSVFWYELPTVHTIGYAAAWERCWFATNQEAVDGVSSEKIHRGLL